MKIIRWSIACLHRTWPPEYSCWTLASRIVGIQC